ncbi:MAG: amino acid ABC transporter permease [Verrucomicrobia bacterium]|nr:MAG: amino acid ABC transporter permease [Verrucomicrobiota bacterium]
MPDSPISRWFFYCPQTPNSIRVFHLLFGIFLLSLASWWIFASELTGWERVWPYRETFLKGWLLTLVLSFASLCLSIFIGLAAALARKASFLPLRSLAAIYVETVRGMPLLVIILLFYYVVAYQLHLENRFVSSVFILSLFSGAYLAEIFRAGIESVGQSQWESARAIGLTRLQTACFVVLPQALRHVLPPLAGQFASLIKDSSLLSIIAIQEFTLAAEQINSATFASLESFFPLAIGYLILTLPMSLICKMLEKKFRYET